MSLKESRTFSPANDQHGDSSSAGSLSVARSSVEKDLISKIEPLAKSLGYGLRDVEVLGGSTIRVILETKDGSTAIGIDDCHKVHEALGPMFDVWDPLPGAYTLEVSSPGEKPTLRLLRHFEAVIGKKIKIETFEPVEVPAPAKPRRRWEGTLQTVDAGAKVVKFTDETGEHSLKFDQIKSAVWLREWDMGPAAKPSKKKMEK